jgi:hypothetical protein
MKCSLELDERCQQAITNDCAYLRADRVERPVRRRAYGEEKRSGPNAKTVMASTMNER